MNYSRNWLYLSKDEQDRLSEIKVLIAGAGIGSYFAELALRTGIKNIIIADGDNIEDSNLNRQNYTSTEVGVNKAWATYEHLKLIDQNANIEFLPKYLTENDLRRMIPSVDFVINTIDFDSPVFQVCSSICREFGKVELFPTNLGFGTSVIVFDECSPNWDHLFEYKDHKELKRRILDFIISHTHVSSFMKESYERYKNEKAIKHDPQLAIASYFSASCMLKLIIDYVKGNPPSTFPLFYYESIDEMVPLENTYKLSVASVSFK